MQKVLGGMHKGLIFVISAPAGTGKTTLVRMLRQEFPCVVENVSYTTRAPRPLEVAGVDYHFISQEAFEEKIREGEFLEYASVFGHHYGTAQQFVLKEQLKGHHVVLIIDTQGALQLMEFLEAVFIFISPPNLKELRERLLMRQSETSDVVERRLSWAEREMTLASRYHYHIVNDHLKTAYDILRAIFIAEEHKNRA